MASTPLNRMISILVLIGLKSVVNFKTEPRIPTRVFSRGVQQKSETFEKCSILPAQLKLIKFNPSTIFQTFGAGRNTLSILRIKLKLHFVQNVEPDPREINFAFHGAGTEIGQKGVLCKGLATLGLR